MGCEESQIAQNMNVSNIGYTDDIANAREAAGTRSPQKAKDPAISFITYVDLQESERAADQLFKEKRIPQAIQAYKKIIEADPKYKSDIDGLGNSQTIISFYEWFVYKWYDEQRTAKNIKGSPYDALSLCYFLDRSNTEKDQSNMEWYKMMIERYGTYQFYIGYAHFLYGKGIYEEAIKMYNKVLEIKPDYIIPEICIAFTHEYRRIQKDKSIAHANKVLKLDPNNQYAMFILARNQKDIDLKIQKLKAVTEINRLYARVTNQIGIVYGGTKKEYREAIIWYQKCTEIVAEYASCYNNIGVNYQLLKQYTEALIWYLRACQYDHQYKTAHVNASDIFDTLNFTDDQILSQMKKYSKIDPFSFYYYLGLAYYDKKKVEISIKWYKKALQLQPDNFKVFNSLGIAYDQIRDYDHAELYYLKCIQSNPKYHSAIYNLAIMYKGQSKIEKAIEYYKKAIEANPRYSYAYNNLGNIYKDRSQYIEAIDCYRRAVQNHSTYTLAYANMGICQLKIERYQAAFHSFSRAKQILPTDNNNLSAGNKTFLKQNLQKFDRQGENWRKTGKIDVKQMQILKNLIQMFQSNFKMIYSGDGAMASDSKALKKQILQIVNMIYEDKFGLQNIMEIYRIIKVIFPENEDYFHIIPQLFIQFFFVNTFQKHRPIFQIQQQLKMIIGSISHGQSNNEKYKQVKMPEVAIRLKHFKPLSENNVNLFGITQYFDNYQALYSQIDTVNNKAKRSLSQFKLFCQQVSELSNAKLYGVNMKLPQKTDQQFKVILRILQKMFKNEINSDRVKSIISKIDIEVRKQKMTLVTIVGVITKVWTKEITEILVQRKNNNIITKCCITDLVRGKIMLKSIQDLSKAITACDDICHRRGYEIIELKNRLNKTQTRDVVLKIKVRDAICQFQLSMNNNEGAYHLIHSIYEIERSPLGCIFGSYLFMSKGVDYPIISNCKDIVLKLKASSKQQDKKTVEAAQYIFDSLKEK